MAHVALTFANQDWPDGAGEPCAGLNVMGRPLIAHCAEAAAAAGCVRMIIICEDIAPAFGTFLESWNAPLETQVVSHAAGVAALVQNKDRVLVLDEAILFDPDMVAEIAAAGDEAGLAVFLADDAPEGALRLDAEQFFAGLACYSGAFVRGVAAGIEDWDLSQTLPRAAISEGCATYIDVGPDSVPDALWIWHHVPDPAAAQAGACEVARRLPSRSLQWPVRWLERGVDRLAVRAAQIALWRDELSFLVFVMGLVSAAAAVWIFPWLSLALFLLSPLLLRFWRSQRACRFHPDLSPAVVRWIDGAGVSLGVVLAAWLSYNSGGWPAAMPVAAAVLLLLGHWLTGWQAQLPGWLTSIGWGWRTTGWLVLPLFALDAPAWLGWALLGHGLASHVGWGAAMKTRRRLVVEPGSQGDARSG